MEYYAIFPGNTAVFLQVQLSAVSPARELSPKWFSGGTSFLLSFYINKDNSPVICRMADRQRRKSSQLHTRKKMPLSSKPDSGIFCSYIIFTSGFTPRGLSVHLPNYNIHTSCHYFLQTHSPHPEL